MRRLLLAVFMLLCVPALQAQVVAVYGTFSPVHLSNVDTGVVSSSGGYTEQQTSFWASGVGGGVTLNFLQLPVVKLGIDLRGSTRPGNSGADTALGSLKLTIKPPLLNIRPYVQGSVGYLAARTHNVSQGSGTGAAFDNKYLAYEFLAGLDLPILRIVDLRLLELGAGEGLNIGLGGQNATLFTVNSGLVLHF